MTRSAPLALARHSSIAAALPSRSPTRWFIWASAMVRRCRSRARRFSAAWPADKLYGPRVALAKAASAAGGIAAMKLLAGNSNLPLARSIADYLDMPLTDASVRRFADEEVFVEINENVRGEDVFVLQSTSFPANDNLMELLICIDALRRASAKRITAVAALFRLCPAGPQTRARGRRFRPSWSPISSPPRAPTGCCRSTFTPGRSRAFSTSRPTICSPRR